MFKKTIFIITGLILITFGFFLINPSEVKANTDSIVLISPNGGENVEIGGTYRIRFNTTIFNDQYCISLLKNNTNYLSVMCSYSYASGENYFDWNVPTGVVISPGSDYKIKIYNTSGTVQDTSDGNFTIFSNLPAVTVTTPNGGENIVKGQNYTIRWNTNWSPDTTDYKVHIYYRQTTGSNQLNQAIVEGAMSYNQDATHGYYVWSAPSTLADGTYKITVTAWGYGTNLSDESDSSFNIISSTPTITVTSPNGGEQWAQGSTHGIAWTSRNLTNNSYGLNLLRSDGTAYLPNFVIDARTNDLDWTIPSTVPVGQYKIEVYAPMAGVDTTASNYKEATDVSNNYFNIVAPVTGSISVISPISGNSYRVGDTVSVQWTMTGSVGPAGEVTIWLYKGSSSIAAMKGTGVSTYGNQYSLFIPSTLGITQSSSDYKIRIISADYPSIYGDSGYFTIAPVTTIQPSITIISPNGGEQWAQGSTHGITWTSRSLTNNSYGLNLLRADGTAYLSNFVIDVRTNNFDWTIPSTVPVGQYKIEVYSPRAGVDTTASNYKEATDVSDNYFSIVSSVATPPDEQCLPDGTLIKIPTDPKIYVIRNCKKEWVETADEFKQEGYKWSDVKEVSSPVLQAYNDYLEATANLLRAIGQQKVYRIVDGKILWVPTVSAFNAQGLKWEDIQDVSESTVNQYPRLKLVRVKGDPKVYYLTESGLKRWIPTIEAFNSYNNKWEDVVELEKKDVNGYSDNVFIKLENDSKVYKIENGKKRWVKTEAAFNRLKIDWNNVSPVNQTEFNFYPEGAVIE